MAIGTGFVVESTEVEPSYLWTATEGSAEGNATSDGMALDLDDPAVTTVRLLRPRRPPLPHSRPTSPALPPLHPAPPPPRSTPLTPEHL